VKKIEIIEINIRKDFLLAPFQAGHTLFREFSTAVEGVKGKNNLHVLADKGNFYFKAHFNTACHSDDLTLFS
jgi:hypothetical protein